MTTEQQDPFADIRNKRMGELNEEQTDQMRAYGQQCYSRGYQQAKEDAARLVLRRWKGGYQGEVVDDCAAAILAMKEKQ